MHGRRGDVRARRGRSRDRRGRQIEHGDVRVDRGRADPRGEGGRRGSGVGEGTRCGSAAQRDDRGNEGSGEGWSEGGGAPRHRPQRNRWSANYGQNSPEKEVKMKKLEGKVAVITGGPSGIGLATAKLFHAEGAQVIVTGTNPATVERAREELRGIATVVRSDSGNSADIASLFAGVVKDHGGLDVLFLNAGIVRSGSIVSLPEADFDEVFRVNVKGPWLAHKTALPPPPPRGGRALHAQQGGRAVLLRPPALSPHPHAPPKRQTRK